MSASSPCSGPAGSSGDPMSDEIDSKKKRGNVILFWVHLALASLILGLFVFSIVHK